MEAPAPDTRLDTPYACLCAVLAYAEQSILPSQRSGKWEIGWHAWHSYYHVQKENGLNACIAGLQGALVLFVKTKLKAEHDQAEDAKCRADRSYQRQHYQFEGVPLYEVLPTLELKSAAAMALIARIDALLKLTDEQLAVRHSLAADLLDKGDPTDTAEPAEEAAGLEDEDLAEMRSTWERRGDKDADSSVDPIAQMLSDVLFAPAGKGIS